jgi:PKD repeat protein
MRITLVLLFFTLTTHAQIQYCKDTIINLTTQPNYEYNWNINGEISSEQSAQIVLNSIGTYQIELTLTNEYGCTSVDKRILIVDSCKEWTYYAPNAFVPDGVNKTWIPVGENITIDMIRIFTREGQVIYEGVGEWNGLYLGNKCIGGVYVYTCDYTTITGQKYKDLGRVTLVR